MRSFVTVIFTTLLLFSGNIFAEEATASDGKVEIETPTASKQAEPEIDRYTSPQRVAREKEIKELKCKICATRCVIVQQAGQSSCMAVPGADNCIKKGEHFIDACLAQCEECP